MRPRIEQELVLLRRHFPGAEHTELNGDDWFRLPGYSVPPGWRIGETDVDRLDVVFHVTVAHPGATPYGFQAPAGLNFKGAQPGNTGAPPKAPPFAGAWVHFSWSVDDWAPNADPGKGSNLLAWAHGFANRFREGA